jgi:GrpB-like predicted nucleotidyltransferase (UPF0157 family)
MEFPAARRQERLVTGAGDLIGSQIVLGAEAASDAVPAWAYEKAEVLPHDPRLAERARTERDRLARSLALWLVDGVEHVGSTAVPGLAAKPVIDLMVSVTDPDAVVAQAGRRLAADGWCYVPPELDQKPWRRFFVKPDASGQRRIAHLHVIQAGHPRWAEQVAFRDALRRDGRLARSYEALKQQLAAQHAGDREAYTDAKAEFVADALRRVAGPGASRTTEAP